MTNSKMTRRALFSSMVALLLCFSMLLGTTYAWFTDSAVSGSNVIKSGNLDIEVKYTLDGKEWADLDGATDLFQKGLWEPGHTEVVVLKITNQGSLALKYAANMNIVSETIGKNKDGADIKLSDILTVSTLTIQADTAKEDTLVDWDASVSLDKAFEKDDTDLALGTPVALNAGNVLESDKELLAGDAHYVFVKVDMAETVGNEANHNGTDIPEINFGINVLATQFTYENDSFGNQYDKDAAYDSTYLVYTVDELKEALKNGGFIKILDNITVDKMLTVSEDTTIFMADDVSLTTTDGYMFYVDGVELTVVNGTYVNENNSGADTAIFAVVGDSNVTILDGDFDGGSGANSVNAVVWTYAGNSTVTIEGGNFTTGTDNGGYAGTIIYVEEGTVNIEGGDFSTDGNKYWNKYWMMNIKDTAAANGTGKINVIGGTYNIDIANDNYEAGIVSDGYKTIENNGKWYVVKDSIDVTVSDATSMAEALTSDYAEINVVLSSDIDLPITTLGSQTAGSGEYKLGGDSTKNITIDLAGNKLNITTTYWSAIGAKNNDATITIKNGSMTSTGNSASTWNAYDVRFCNCNYVLENVTFDKAVALDNAGKTTTMKNVTINENSGDYYALWITAEGQNVNINGLTVNSTGRGIKIDEQYVAAAEVETVKLNVSNATFATAKKSAIIVKSAQGADITLDNVDISKVSADSVNAVWVDSDSSAYASLVTVVGGTVIVEK